jgi:peptidyl-prolyl cis-trans isomerase C
MEGGDLGYMTEDEAAPEFARVIRTTPTGGLSKPFETEMGWHVAKIDERRKEQPPSLEELREPILKHLTMMQIGEELKSLRTKARIEKHTSPQNSTLDVDPFTLDPEERPKANPGPAQPPAAAPPETTAPATPPAFDAQAPKPATQAPPPAATPPSAGPPATQPAPPSATQPAPASAQPSRTGPVSETRTPTN